MYDNWFRRHGARAGAWLTAAIDLNRRIPTSKGAPTDGRGFLSISIDGTAPGLHTSLYWKRIFSAAGNNFPRGDLFPHISLK
jgi:hypothetical protein